MKGQIVHLVLIAVCLTLAACQTGAYDNVGSLNDDVARAHELSTELPAVSLLANKAVQGSVAYEVDPSAFEYQDGATTGEFEGDPTAILDPAASGSTAWVMYNFSIPEGAVYSGINLDVDDGDLEDDVWVPALPFYIGVANFAKSTWEWFGPYNDFMAAPRVEPDQARETYVSEAGAAWWVILSYCPQDEEPSATTVMYIDCAYETAD